MRLRFWGTRSSVATPGMDTCELGGNTACIQVFVDEGRSLLLNSGTGIIEYATRSDLSDQREFHILLSGLTWDLIQGFPFFSPIHVPGSEIHLYAPMATAVMLENFVNLFDGSYSPLRDMSNLNARIHFHTIPAEGVTIHGARVAFQPVSYPGAAFAYRIQLPTGALACVLKHEHSGGAPAETLEFLRGADLLVLDGQYTPEEYQPRVGWGHSTIDEALELALAADVGALFVASHDPGHSDNFLRMYLRRLKARHGLGGPSGLQVELAAEHREWELHDGHRLIERRR